MVAAMSSMQQQNNKTQTWDTLETSLKHLISLLKLTDILETPVKYSSTILEHALENPLKFPESNIETLKLPWNYLETPLKHPSSSLKKLFNLPLDTIETSFILILNVSVYQLNAEG